MIDDYHERFAGYANLVGPHSLEILRQSPITIVGLGGVGSWAAEALVRSGCGRITLVDYDHISLGNTNRQLHALDGFYGQSKVAAMSARLKQINPTLDISEVDDFLIPDNIQDILDPTSAVIDACDKTFCKIAMAKWAVDHAIPFVMCGSAGGRIDPSLLKIGRMASVSHDILVKKIRRGLSKLDRCYDDTLVIYSTETKKQLQHPVSGNGISCTGYGSCVTVTATMGFLAVHSIINQMIK